MGCGALFAFALLLDCPSGDFGRAPADYPREEAREILSAQAVAPRLPSALDLTDSEAELRDRAFALIAPPYSRQFWLKSLVPLSGGPADMPDLSWYRVAAYGERLIAMPARSPASRYARLIDDLRNDLVRLPDFMRVAAQVADLDTKRLKSFAYVRAVPPQDFVEAQRRVAENRCIVEWVCAGLTLRAQSYRIALERLIVIAPDARAVEAERLLLQFEQVASACHGALPRLAARPLVSK